SVSSSYLTYLLLRVLRPPGSTLFPYTTLFRSSREILPRERHSRLRLYKKPLFYSMGIVTAVSSIAFLAEALVLGYVPFLKPKLRSEEHTSELQSRFDLVCRLLLEKKKKYITGV